MPLDPRLSRAVEAHLNMAETLVWKFCARLPSGDVDELRSIAFEAVVRAAGRLADPYCSAHGYDPWDKADPSRPEAHFGGYVAKTVNGALLDWARHQDHVTRGARYKIKALRAAQDAGARGEAETAAMAGLSVEKAREVLAADAARPASLDDQDALAGGQYAGAAVLDHGANVESQAVVNETLAAFMAAFGALSPVQQVLLAFVFHQELELEVAAKAVYLSELEARQQLEAAVLAVHRALLLSVSA